jgi:hypothetical protein
VKLRYLKINLRLGGGQSKSSSGRIRPAGRQLAIADVKEAKNPITDEITEIVMKKGGNQQSSE